MILPSVWSGEVSSALRLPTFRILSRLALLEYSIPGKVPEMTRVANTGVNKSSGGRGRIRSRELPIVNAHHVLVVAGSAVYTLSLLLLFSCTEEETESLEVK